jgi:hypothetical protein
MKISPVCGALKYITITGCTMGTGYVAVMECQAHVTTVMVLNCSSSLAQEVLAAFCVKAPAPKTYVSRQLAMEHNQLLKAEIRLLPTTRRPCMWTATFQALRVSEGMLPKSLA